jgi:hypothetical protein
MSSSSNTDMEIDELAQHIITEIEHTKSTDLAESDEMIKILHLTNVHHARKLLEYADQAPTRQERDIGKKAVVEALLVSTWHTRLYFIIRAFIMGIIGSIPTFLFVLFAGPIRLPVSFLLGLFSFVFSLAVSRLLDVPIVRATKTMTDYLASHKALRNFILDHF